MYKNKFIVKSIIFSAITQDVHSMHKVTPTTPWWMYTSMQCCPFGISSSSPKKTKYIWGLVNLVDLARAIKQNNTCWKQLGLFYPNANCVAMQSGARYDNFLEHWLYILHKLLHLLTESKSKTTFNCHYVVFCSAVKFRSAEILLHVYGSVQHPSICLYVC